MPEQEPYEILGTLITDGIEVILDMTGGEGIEGYKLGDESIFALRQELSSYGDAQAKILVARLNVIIAERELIHEEEILAGLKEKRELEGKKEPEAKSKEEGV